MTVEQGLVLAVMAGAVGLLVWREPLSPVAWLGGLLILAAGLAIVWRPSEPVEAREGRSPSAHRR